MRAPHTDINVWYENQDTLTFGWIECSGTPNGLCITELGSSVYVMLSFREAQLRQLREVINSRLAILNKRAEATNG